MKATFDLVCKDIIDCLNEYGNIDKIDEWDFDEWKDWFRNKYDNEQTWPIQSIPEYITNLIVMLKLQRRYDREQKM